MPSLMRGARALALLALAAPAAAGGQSLQVKRPVEARQLGVFRSARMGADLGPRTQPGGTPPIALQPTTDFLDPTDDSLWLVDTTSSSAATEAAVVSPARSPVIAVSRLQANVLWSLGPQGSEPELYAADSVGHDLGTFRFNAAAATDWATLALGPCGPRTCIYIGDTGDDLENRPQVTLYRLVEPLLSYDRTARTFVVPQVEKIDLRYPDGAHDVRAMLVERDGGILLFSAGARSPVHIYRLKASAWFDGGTALARLLPRFPFELRRLGPLIGAAHSPDGARVVIRTTRAAVFLNRIGSDSLVGDPTIPACDLGPLKVSGQGIDWFDSRRIILTGNRVSLPAPALFLVRCAGF